MEKEYFIFENGFDHHITVIDHLTLNTTPGGKGYSYHEGFELYLFLDGDLSISVEGISIDITPGDMVLLKPHVMHRINLHKVCRYHRKHVVFDNEIFSLSLPYGNLLYQSLYKQDVIKITEDTVCEAGLDRLLDEIIQHIRNHTHYDDFCALVSLLRLLISCVNQENSQSVIKNERAFEIMRYIDSHIHEKLDYRKISEHFYISEKSLYHIIQRETGFSPTRYLNERRIMKAKTLLMQGIPATESARLTGYQDYTAFYRNFKKYTGISPAHYCRIIRERNASLFHEYSL